MFLFQKSVERRPVVHIGVPDTIVTIDNRRAANATIVQIAGTENKTEPGSETRATFFGAFSFFASRKLCGGGGHPDRCLPPFACRSLLQFNIFFFCSLCLLCSTHDHFRLLRPPAIPRPLRRATTRRTHRRTRHQGYQGQAQGRKGHHRSECRNGEQDGTRM